MNKPLVKLCAWCQGEYPEITKSVQRSQNQIDFSHGVCKRHAAFQYKQMGKDDAFIKSKIDQMQNSVPDLKENPELVKAYSEGNFFPNQSLRERFQKLANIKS